MPCKTRSHPTADPPKNQSTLIGSRERSEVKNDVRTDCTITLQAHMFTAIIFNGVCVKWVGSMDLESLTGKARLVFNEEMAKVCVPSVRVRV